MNTARAILEALETRDLADVARRIAVEHHVQLEEVCSGAKSPPVVRARYELFRELWHVLGSGAAVARVFGCDPSTVNLALQGQELEGPPIVAVLLAEFKRGGLPRFEWVKRPKESEPFSVTTDAGARWFFAYGDARQAYVTACAEKGAPTSFYEKARAEALQSWCEAGESGGAR